MLWRRWLRTWWEAAGVALLAGAVYLASMAPTITWRNGGDDGAELAAAAWVWGVGHPPGYPLYLTLVRLLQAVPLLGEPARAAALFSGLCAVAAVVGVYALTRQVLCGSGGSAGWRERVGASFAALAFAFGPLLWSQAVVAEVYAFEACLLAWALLALARWLETLNRRDGQPDHAAEAHSARLGLVPARWTQTPPDVSRRTGPPRAAGHKGLPYTSSSPGAHPNYSTEPRLQRRTLSLALGLTLLASHHPPMGLLFLPIGWLAWRRGGLARRTWLLAGGITLLGPLLLLTLWLRASFQPPLDWGDPSSPGRWWQQITAAAYQGYVLLVPWRDELLRVPVAVSLVIRQGGWTTLALGALGVTWLWQERRALAAILFGLSAGVFAFTIIYNARDGQVYLIPLTLVLALSAGVGATWLLQEVAVTGSDTAIEGDVGEGLVPSRSRRTPRHMTPPAQPAGGDKPRPYSRQAHPDLASLVSVVALTGVLAGTVAWQVWVGWGEVDVAGNTQARDWAVSTLQAAPQSAVLRSMDDSTTFPLWYAQHALGMRPDVAIEDGRLASGFDWYRRQLLAQYPQLRPPEAVQAVASGQAPDGVPFVDVPMPPEAGQ